MTILLTILFGLLGGLGTKFGIELWRERRLLRRVARLEIDANAALRRADPEFAALLLDEQPSTVAEARALLWAGPQGQGQTSLAEAFAATQMQHARMDHELARIASQPPQHTYRNAYFAAASNWQSAPPYSAEPAGISAIVGSAAVGGIGGLGKPKGVQ